jgi:hypothetical protein
MDQPAFRSDLPYSSASAAGLTFLQQPRPTLPSLGVRLDATVVSSPGERLHPVRVISCLAGAHDCWPAESREYAKPADADPVITAAAPVGHRTPR